MAGVLACGPKAVLSHRSAAVLWGIRRGDATRTEVTVPRRLGGREGIRSHRVELSLDEITEVDGIPTTTVARTLLDLALLLDRPQLERAIEQAEALRLSDATPLATLVTRYPGRPGTAVLKRILGAEAPTAGMTRSELEDRFLRFLADRRLPPPRTNVWLQIGADWIEVDCVWPDGRVVAELDSWGHHATRAAFRRDRARDRRLRVAGWQPIRITAWDLAEDPHRLELELRTLTSACRATP
jgi:very-short-patch-repair endonuclease